MDPISPDSLLVMEAPTHTPLHDVPPSTSSPAANQQGCLNLQHCEPPRPFLFIKSAALGTLPL